MFLIAFHYAGTRWFMPRRTHRLRHGKAPPT